MQRKPYDPHQHCPKSASGDLDSIRDAPPITPSPMNETADDEVFDVAVLERDYEQFGWGRMRFDCLQWCRNPWGFLACLCILNIAHRFGVWGVFPSAFREMEIQFHTSEFLLALVRCTYDWSFAIGLVPFMINPGKRLNRPQWLGFRGFVMAVGAVVCALAHFSIRPPPQFPPSTCFTQSNNSSSSDNSCTDISTERSIALFCLAIGCSMIGYGAAPLAVLGITYLDDNVSFATSAICTVFFALSEYMGHALGAITMAIFLHFEDAARPKFVGNESQILSFWSWWGAMFINAAIAFVGAVWISAFPETLRGSTNARVKDARRSIMKRSEVKIQPDMTTGEKRKLIWDVAKNCTFWALVVEECCRAAVVGGGIALFCKYVVIIFGASPVEAASLQAAITIVSAVIALSFLILLQSKFQLGVAGNLKLALVASVLSFIFKSVFFVKCPMENVAGINYPFPGQNRSSIAMTAPCNERCNCTADFPDPVCFHDKNAVLVYYFSPCHAGCEETDGWNCECVKENDYRGNKHGCDSCSKNKLAAFTIGVVWLAVAWMVRPALVRQSILRIVPFKGRLVALAILYEAQIIFGVTPGVLGFAKLFEWTCLEYKTYCGKPGMCVWNDREQLAKIAVVFRYYFAVVSIVALVVAWISNSSKRSSPVEKTTVIESERSSFSTTSTTSDTSSSMTTTSRGDW